MAASSNFPLLEENGCWTPPMHPLLDLSSAEDCESVVQQRARRTAPEGARSVIALHLLQAGFGLTWQPVAILYVIRHPELPGQILQLLTSFRPDEYAVLMIDLLSLFLSFVYLTALEDGILMAFLEVVGACMFGPAFTVSTYCAFREQSISKAASRVRGKKQD